MAWNGRVATGATALLVVAVAACSSTGSSPGGSGGVSQWMKPDTGQGVVVGTLSGAVIGAVADPADPWAGALIGAAGGALAGGLAGHYMDQRKQDLAKTLQPQVAAGDAALTLLPGNALQVEMTGTTRFAPGSSVVNAAFLGTLQPIAQVLQAYGKMTLQVIGHPDAGGTPEQRMTLANQRAEAVRTQLLGMGVPAVLISASGTAVGDANDGRAVLILRPIIAGVPPPP